MLSESVTLFKAASEKVIQDVAMCANILKQTCEILMFIHERGFLHNDLKSNNVVIDGSEKVRAHFGQSNFPFFQQKRKKEILLILVIFTYFKVQTKIEKKKMVRKIDHFFIFLILKSASKIQKKIVNG